MHIYIIYIDPGSGSFLVQAIIAAVLGVAVYFKNIRMKIKSFFSRKNKDEIPPKDS